MKTRPKRRRPMLQCLRKGTALKWRAGGWTTVVLPKTICGRVTGTARISQQPPVTVTVLRHRGAKYAGTSKMLFVPK